MAELETDFPELNRDDPTREIWPTPIPSRQAGRPPGLIHLNRYPMGLSSPGIASLLQRPVTLTPADLQAANVDVASWHLADIPPVSLWTVGCVRVASGSEGTSRASCQRRRRGCPRHAVDLRGLMMAHTSAEHLEASPDSSGGDAGRLVFVDVLRVVVIGLVVAHHAAQPYGPTGGDWVTSDPASMAWLGPFFTVNAAFGMGLLFFLAGYFVPGSYDRRGATPFLSARWIRIGVPLALVVLFVHVPVVYLTDPDAPSASEFVSSLYASGWQDAYLHLWFLGHLLLYSAAYAAWRLITDLRSNHRFVAWPVPSHVGVVSFVVALALVTWVVRWWYPVDEWVPMFFVMAVEPAHLPQYVILFGLGTVAYRGDWLRRIPTRIGMIWLGIGLVAVSGVYAFKLAAPERWSDATAPGGFGWQSLLSSSWEALICAGMCLGLVVVFRAVFHRTNRFLAAMVAASYAAYILHLMIVIGLQLGLEGTDVPVLAKFGLVTAFGVLLAFGAGYVSRWIPGVRVALGTTPAKRDPAAAHREVRE
jgi:glucan biosynthesis protein C